MSTAAPPLLHLAEVEAVLPGGAGLGPLTLRVRAGESVLVLGPSGAGKSTLLRLLHGAVPQAVHAHVTGEVRVGGRRLAGSGRDDDGARVRDLADLVGVVAQDPLTGVCLPTVDEDVAFVLESLATDPATIGDRVAGALARVGAAHLAGRDTTTLSGGELQRVALAAASVAAPPLLLLDEPTSMLDGPGVQAMREALLRVRRETGAAVVLVEHRLDELAGDDGPTVLPERWLVLGRDGRLRYDGPAAELPVEVARDLVADGCWVPWAVEHAALGAAWDASGDDLPPAPPTPSAGEVVLRTRGLAVGPPGRGPARRRVLGDVDLELRRGETVALVGANGSGKSTLLACLAGVARPVAGQVEGAPGGLVFQHPEHQFAERTVRAEAGHGLRPPQPALVEELLGRFELAEHADRHPFQLSGGQQRRLSVAAVLAHERPVLLADEPGFGLDRRASVTTLRALRDAAARGRAVVFTSHDLRAVCTHADRVLLVHEGGVVDLGGPAELLRAPASLAAAGLHPSPLLRDLVTERGDSEGLRRALWSLDDAFLALAGSLADDRRPA